MIYVFLFLGAVLLTPVLAEALRWPVAFRRRKRKDIQLANLPRGATHYRWHGPENGPVIVCIHGLSTPSYVFAATERSLANLGYRVLTYDLYGRGYSSRVRGKQTVTFFLTQLRALLKHQEVSFPISVLGFSMGAQVAAAFAAEERDRIDHLVLVAPAGLTMTDTTGQSNLWTMPLIGDWATLTFGGMALRRELVEHKSEATVIPDLEDRQASETRVRGFLPALLSSRRYTLSKRSDPAHELLFDAGTPVLAIWGTDDPVIPLAAMGRLSKLNPDVHHAQIPGAGHNLLQTHPAQIADALAGFLSE